MSKLIVLSLAACLLLSGVQSWGGVCAKALFNTRPLSYKADYFKRWIEGQVDGITNEDSLAKYLFNIGDIGQENLSQVHSMSSLFFIAQNREEENDQSLIQKRVQKMVRNLVLSYRHQARESVGSALLAYTKGEVSSGKELEVIFPTALESAEFLRLSRIGDTIEGNIDFMQKLEAAVKGFKEFENEDSIKVPQAFWAIVVGFKNLSNSSFVGKFIEQFLLANPITQRYFVEQIVELEDRGFYVGVQLKGSKSEDRNSVEKTLDILLAKSLEELQKDAYLRYPLKVPNRVL